MKSTKFDSACGEILNEGYWDRLKASGQGLKTLVKGTGDYVKGVAKGAVAGAKGNVAGVQQAQDLKTNVLKSAAHKRNAALLKNHRAKLSKLVDEMATDLLAMKLVNDADIQRFKTNIMNAANLVLPKAFRTPKRTGIRVPKP